MITAPTGYTAAQALARDLLNLALNGDARVYWAHVHGVSLDCPPEQVRAEGIHLSDRTVWSVDLDDVTRAVTTLIEHPGDCAEAATSAIPAPCPTPAPLWPPEHRARAASPT